MNTAIIVRAINQAIRDDLFDYGMNEKDIRIISQNAAKAALRATAEELHKAGVSGAILEALREVIK